MSDTKAKKIAGAFIDSLKVDLAIRQIKNRLADMNLPDDVKAEALRVILHDMENNGALGLTS